MDDRPRRARTALKYALYAVAACLLAGAALVTYLVAAFDPRDHIARLAAIVQEKTGRTLQIEGAIDVTVWPAIGVRVNGVSLTERDGRETFARIETLELETAIEPLVRRRALVVNELVMDGVHVQVTRDADGRLNVADLFAGEGEPPQFEVGRVRIRNAALRFHDEASGADYELSDIHLETSRIADGVPTRFTVDARLRDAHRTLGLMLKLQGRLEPARGEQARMLSDVRLALEGRVGALDDLDLTASSARLAAADEGMSAGVLSFRLAGRREGERFTVTARAAESGYSAGMLRFGNVDGTATLDGTAGHASLKLATPALTAASDRIRAERAALDLDLVREGHRIDASIVSPLEIEIARQRLTLPQLHTRFTVTGARLPRDGVMAELEGEARLDGKSGTLALTAAGRVDRSAVRGRFFSTGFEQPTLRVQAHIDRLDLDRYLGAQADARAKTRRGDDPLAALSDLPASGTLDIGALTAAGVRAKNVRVELQ